MKNNPLRSLFAPLLNSLDSGNGPYEYKPSFRKILMVVGLLFLVLATGCVLVAIYAGLLASLMPGVVFTLAGLCCVVVATLGTDRAVARIWNNRK
ncbi:hypothetical protein [Parathalassolituus penaei]|uniref:Uncharacterized protein n=1 Tax=Parathalassolituus penaei TaxID=2997323 RepID=A0A9X3EAK5_9GAMM|nr:hypothetical protein [Parathalassolituus penaei]MCY0964002.1 hypothetical protein [Parathalassolituus penaei]